MTRGLDIQSGKIVRAQFVENVQWEVRTTDKQGRVHMVLRDYREPSPSEKRHHWRPGLDGTAMCAHCCLRMVQSGGHTRTCYGAGRP